MNLEARGIPTVTFVTTPFESAARTHAEILGMPDLPLVIIPSDYIDGSDDVVAAKVAPLIDDVLAKLLLPAG